MANYFDEENHIYYYNNIEVPSITEIAKPISLEATENLKHQSLRKETLNRAELPPKHDCRMRPTKSEFKHNLDREN